MKADNNYATYLQIKIDFRYDYVILPKQIQY
jgi:hypothetical protein